MSRLDIARLIVAFSFVVTLLAPSAAQARELTVFAAASLTDALQDLSAMWVQRGHQAPRMSFGSVSTLARQIEQGAPADVFASADEKWMDYLQDRDLIAKDTRTDVLGNDLVLIVPAEPARQIALAPSAEISRLLGADGRIATGDPAHVPVGIYAEQALRKLGLWATVEPRLARTDNVRSALLLVERGEAAAGIVYTTDALVSKRVAIAATFPPESHDAVTYPFALTRLGDTPDARALLGFLIGPEARAVFIHYGFKAE